MIEESYKSIYPLPIELNVLPLEPGQVLVTNKMGKTVFTGTWRLNSKKPYSFYLGFWGVMSHHVRNGIIHLYAGSLS